MSCSGEAISRIRQISLDEMRQSSHPELPTRLGCFFGFDRLEDVRWWLAFAGGEAIYEVQATGPWPTHRGDMLWLAGVDKSPPVDWSARGPGYRSGAPRSSPSRIGTIVAGPVLVVARIPLES